ncbi:T9SS type A sorting domain-containing protein [bacterium]|nr:T9SS type A sorting domain-containing protein [bacterium]
MKYFTLLLFTLFFIHPSAQGQMLTVWSNSSGSAQSETMTKSVVDENDNVYFVSSFSSTYEFDANHKLNSAGGKDIVVAKLNSSGELQWSKSYGSDKDDMGYDIALTNKGDVVVTGAFSGTIDFGSGTNLTSKGGFDAFAVSINNSGNVNWAVSGGGSDDDKAMSIDTDNKGNIYMAGTVSSADGFFGILPVATAGSDDVFFATISSNGSILLAKTLGSSGSEALHGMNVSSSGKIMLSMSLENSIIFGQDTLNSSAGLNATLVFNSEGLLQWVSQNSKAMSMGMVSDDNDNIYSTGSFEGTAKFGSTTLTSMGGKDIFVMKQNAQGKIMWVGQAGGSGDDVGSDVLVMDNAEVFVGGYFEGTSDFGNDNMTSTGGTDNFVASINGEGTFMNSIQSGGSGDDMVNSINSTSEGEIVASGTFEGTSSFKKASETSKGQKDNYVWKIQEESTSIAPHNSEPLTIFPNPASREFTLNLSQTSQIYIRDMAGNTVVNYGYASGKSTFNISQMAKGIYFVEVLPKGNNRRQVTKLVVK